MPIDLSVCLWTHPGPLETALDDAARAGFCRIDIARPPSFARTFRDLCAARGLEVSGVPLSLADDLGFEFRGREPFEETVRSLASQLDAAVAVGAPTVYLGAPEPRWRYFQAGRLRRLADGLARLANRREVTICLAPQPWTLLKTARHALEFLADLPEIRILLGHSDEDLGAALRTAGRRVGYLQLMGESELPADYEGVVSLLVPPQPDLAAGWRKARRRILAAAGRAGGR